jgi:hypothetical protein
LISSSFLINFSEGRIPALVSANIMVFTMFSLFSL